MRRAGKQHGCTDDLELAGFYMEQGESWTSVSSHYNLSVMCFLNTVALERLLCNYVTIKTDFSRGMNYVSQVQKTYAGNLSCSCGFSNIMFTDMNIYISAS